MHLRQVEIELDQPAIEPAGENRMYQALQLFKEENIERQGIPMPGELHRSVLRAGGPMRQQRDAHANPKMQQYIARCMRYVAMKQNNDRLQPRQIRVRHPLERAESCENFG